MTNKLRHCFAILVAILIVSPDVSAEAWRYDDVRRVVAIADVHGAYAAMVETLQQADILDAELAWSGGDAHLVVVGDILDRGPNSRAAMDLLMRLESDADRAGGKVHVLIGNHESMLLTGDMRYVSAAEYAAFEDDETQDERTREFDRYAARHDSDVGALRASFDKAYPPGYFAMRRAFRADGEYGRWLLEKQIAVVINGTAFVHGGLSPSVAALGLDAVNADLRRELAALVKALNALDDGGVILPTDSHYDYAAILDAFAPPLDASASVLAAVDTARTLLAPGVAELDGPLWYRSNAHCQKLVEKARLLSALDTIGARRLVVGHTPTPGRKILQRFDGRLIEIDTGMLGTYYEGSGNALVLEGDATVVVNQSGSTGVPLPHPRRVGRRAAGLTVDDLTELLRSGDIVSVGKTKAETANPLPRTVVRVSNGMQTVDAVFSRRKGRGFYPSVAAYRLDRLLGLDMVPVTVVREVDGKAGSLQFMPAGAVSEFERQGRGGNAICPLEDQWSAMSVFDALVFNEGRIQQRMLYDPSSWQLVLSEHDRTFATNKGWPAHLQSTPLAVTPGWKIALASLDDETLNEDLGDVLTKKRLRALFARRDALRALSTVTSHK